MSGLTVLQMVASTAEEKTGIAVLGINIKAILLQAGTFLILFLIIKKFALKKIVGALEARRKTINDSLDKAEALQKANEQAEERMAHLLKEARVEADKLIAQAHEESGSIIKNAEDSAVEKANKLLDDAHARIGEDIEKARKGLEKDMRVLVAEATEVIIGQKLDAQKDSELISKALAGARK